MREKNASFCAFILRYLPAIFTWVVVLCVLTVRCVNLSGYGFIEVLKGTADVFVLIVLMIVKDIAVMKEKNGFASERSRVIAEREELYKENIRLNELLKQEANARKDEIQRARQIHDKVLPEANNLTLKGIKIAGGSIPAKEMGGDYYDIFRMKDSRVLVVLCDVMGKGLSAALLTLFIRNAIRCTIDGCSSVKDLLNGLNRVLYEDLNSMDCYTTMFAVIYDYRERRIYYSNAGHSPSLVISRDGEDVKSIRTKGTAIGLKKDVQYQEDSVVLEKGDIICIYSDGVTDAENAAGERYGTQNLLDAIKTNIDKELMDLEEAVLTDIGRFMGNWKQKDDITMVLMKVTD